MLTVEQTSSRFPLSNLTMFRFYVIAVAILVVALPIIDTQDLETENTTLVGAESETDGIQNPTEVTRGKKRKCKKGSGKCGKGSTCCSGKCKNRKCVSLTPVPESNAETYSGQLQNLEYRTCLHAEGTEGISLVKCNVGDKSQNLNALQTKDYSENAGILKFEESSMCLTVKNNGGSVGALIIQAPCADIGGANNQLWKVISGTYPGPFQLQSIRSYHCLTAEEDGTYVDQYDCRGMDAPWQYWQIFDPSIYKFTGYLKNLHYDKCVRVDGAKKGLGVTLGDCDLNDPGQPMNALQIKGYATDSGILRFDTSFLCFTVRNNGFENEDRIVQENCAAIGDANNQLFKLISGTYPGPFQLQALHSGRCLTAETGPDGSYLDQYECRSFDSTPWQYWKVVTTAELMPKTDQPPPPPPPPACRNLGESCRTQRCCGDINCNAKYLCKTECVGAGKGQPCKTFPGCCDQYHTCANPDNTFKRCIDMNEKFCRNPGETCSGEQNCCSTPNLLFVCHLGKCTQSTGADLCTPPGDICNGEAGGRHACCNGACTGVGTMGFNICETGTTCEPRLTPCEPGKTRCCAGNTCRAFKDGKNYCLRPPPSCGGGGKSVPNVCQLGYGGFGWRCCAGRCKEIPRPSSGRHDGHDKNYVCEYGWKGRACAEDNDCINKDCGINDYCVS